MPTSVDIQRYMTGAWQLMMGKPDGMRLLDVSADGFWNSFLAIAIALPALIVGWVAIANGTGDAEIGGRLSILLRLAAIDLLAWVLPLVALAFIARPVGMADRFVHYVVASNWASALIVWLMLPVALLNLLLPEQTEVADAVSLVVFLLAMVLTWRMTNAVLGKGPALATAIFVFVLVVSMALLVGLQSLFGLMPSGSR
ncbi:MAG: transporter [Mesorhizobium sp.]|nr:transporter [Mesorhizobium sp.]